MRFSGHETFPLRYAWLPKAFQALERDASGLADDERAMIDLGIGKNMLKALRFWVEVCGVATPGDARGYHLTDFGRAVFDPDRGFDPYLEDLRTLWLIHWKIATHSERPVFAWRYLLNDWQYPELCRGELVEVFLKESRRYQRTRSRVTIAQHLDIFLHTYLPTRRGPRSVREDILDCPLIEIELLQQIGERKNSKGRREPVYAFRREAKAEITDGLFACCLAEYWDKERPAERTLSFRDIAVAVGSVGQVFKLPESDLRERLERLEAGTDGAFVYQPSAAEPSVARRDAVDRGSTGGKLLAAAYAVESPR